MKNNKTWLAVKNNLFLFRLAWDMCPKRIIATGILYFLDYFEWIFYSSFFMRFIIFSAEENKSAAEIFTFIYLSVLVFVGVNLYNSWYEAKLKPITDTVLYQELYRVIYQKASNADLYCFEDSDFYNKYTLALEHTDERVIEIINNIWSIIFGTAAVIVSCGLMFQLDRFAIVFVLGPVIGNFVFGAALNHVAYKCVEESVPYKRVADYVNRIVHLSDYAKEIRLTNILKVMMAKYHESVKNSTDVIDKYSIKSILYGWGYLYFTFTVIFEGVMLYGAYRTMVSKTMQLSGLSVLSSLMVAVSWILIGYSKALMDLIKNGLFINNLKGFLNYTPKIPEDTDGITPNGRINRIEFENVSFSYKNRQVLKDFNLVLENNKTYAMVGHNGAGKSTIIKLLLRLYDPCEGRILLNGRDIREFNLQEYRKLFTTAFQDGQVFAGTIRENVLMRHSNGNDVEERVWKALSLAGLKNRVQQFPQGINTVITKEFFDSGVILSGGQNQKLVAARAFVQETAEVMIFDEPSSALDPIAEYDLFKSILEAKGNRILLFISHRLSSVQEADCVFLLEEGELVESGTHQELLKMGGKYSYLYHIQARNYNASIDF